MPRKPNDKFVVRINIENPLSYNEETAYVYSVDPPITTDSSVDALGFELFIEADRARKVFEKIYSNGRTETVSIYMLEAQYREPSEDYKKMMEAIDNELDKN